MKWNVPSEGRTNVLHFKEEQRVLDIKIGHDERSALLLAQAACFADLATGVLGGNNEHAQLSSDQAHLDDIGP